MSVEAALRDKLISLARDALAAAVSGRPLPAPEPGDAPPLPCGGMFVTLRNRGRLRGCIGTFQPPANLEETVVETAAAAVRDPRFVLAPITREELDHLDLEISLLSPPVRTHDPLSLRPGIDGVLIHRGEASGCFLPQVATEQGWNAEQTLSHCCAGKANLPPEAWRDPQTEVYFFTAEIIEDRRATPRRKAPGQTATRS